MKKIIYYFIGTGNSMRTAVRIAENIGGAEIISVRCDAETVSAGDADVIGFVCPVYEWDIPGTMRDFAKKLIINPHAYIFMVATYIAIHGKAFETMAKILSDKGARLNTVITKRLGLPEKQKKYHNPFIKAADLMKDRQHL